MKSSSKLCTFNTPYGRYRFRRLSFGIKSAPEVFQHRMSELFEDVEGVKAIVDDLLIWGKDDDEHDARLKQVLNRAREVNLKFNAKKCRIRQEEVSYVGHALSKEGLRPDPEKIRAVQEMQPPQNTKELKSFLGFIQYLAKFMPNMASVHGLPVLFSVMVNDLVNTWSKRAKYVDDLTILEIIPRNSPSYLNCIVDDIQCYSHCNNMRLNPAKCKAMTIDFLDYNS